MRLEHLPIVLGVLVGLIGLFLIADAWMPDDGLALRERRRRQRAERHRLGEGLVGVGTLCLAAALIGRDTWRYGTLSVLIGTILLVAGVVLNRAYLKETLLFRGAARRVEPAEGERPIAVDAEPGARPGQGRPPNGKPGAHTPGRETTPPPRLRIR